MYILFASISILAAFSFVLLCPYLIYLLIKHIKRSKVKCPFRIVENGLGEYILQEYDYLNTEWKNIDSSGDYLEMECLYNERVKSWKEFEQYKKFNDKKMKETKEYEKLSKKIVKVLK